jgi:DNA-binding transcriptional ArsR family regulator
VLRAMANPSRLQILFYLLKGEASVATLDSELGIRQPNLSQHLRCLREAKLVSARREAKSVFYSLSGAHHHRSLGKALQRIFDDSNNYVPPTQERPDPTLQQEAARFARLR